jgi:ABC-2 type transport system permease protein
MNNMLWLIRREIWENRSFWIAPLVVSGLVLIAAAFGGIHVGNGPGGEFWFGWQSDGEMDHMAPAAAEAAQSEITYGKTMAMFTVVQLIVLGFVVFFYLLDALLTERKDRSILFWKSLPVSDVEVVASKLLTGLVVAPIFVLLVSAATQILFAPIWSIRASMMEHSTPLMAWDISVWLQVQAAFWALVPAVVVWYLPLAGYCLLVSVWARKNAFLWALLPPAAILLIEGLLMNSSRFWYWLLDRFIGVFKILFKDGDKVASGDEFAEVLRRIGHVFVDGETWLGVFVAVALFAVVVRFRRYRDDS